MITLTVNGTRRSFDGDPTMPLLWFLRDELALTGTKYGCGIAQCGSCTVHVAGKPARACQMLMSELQDAAVTTIEGLHPKGEHPLQVAWREIDVPQCGFCQPGQIMQAAGLLQRNAEAKRPGHRRRDERPHLPLRHVSTHSRGDQGRSGEKLMSANEFLPWVRRAAALQALPELPEMPAPHDAGRADGDSTFDLQRRTFIQLLGLGGLVIAFGPGGVRRLEAAEPHRAPPPTRGRRTSTCVSPTMAS